MLSSHYLPIYTAYNAMHTSDKVLKFEVLCVDSDGKVPFKSEKSFISSLLSNESLWDEPEKAENENEFYIFDKKKTIRANIQKLDMSKTANQLDNSFYSAFIVSLEGNYEELEPLRYPLLLHLKTINFKHVSLLTDDVSAYISNQIYPLLNRLENSLRRYIVKFFTTKIGSDWLDVVLSPVVTKKATDNKKGEKIFSDMVKMDLFFTHFNEIGEIIYQQTTAFSDVQALVNKIESATSLEQLKAEVQGNHAKYFKDNFQEKDFQTMWKTCNNIRNKVAHNRVFSDKELQQAKRDIDALMKIIKNADDKVDEVVFSNVEKEAIEIAREKAELANYEAFGSEVEDIEDKGYELSSEEQQDSLPIRDILGIIGSRYLNEPSHFHSSPANIDWLKKMYLAAKAKRFYSVSAPHFGVKKVFYEKNRGQLISFLKDISESNLIKKFKDFQEVCQEEIVPLEAFVTSFLSPQGYIASLSYKTIDILVEKGYLERVSIANPEGEAVIEGIKLIREYEE